MKYSEDVAKKLNNLLEKNYDSEEGYKMAAENVKSPELKEFFTQRAKERYDFGHELKSEIKSFGQDPEKGTSLKADIHRGWMDLKASLSSDNEEAVLEEAVRGEKAAVDEYNEVLKSEEIPPSTGNVLMKQRNSITDALNKLKSLEQWKD